uniref:Protein ripply3 n=1 Tax=Xenopus tropicalis TaxID=8364 RepID=A0A803K4H0_XENTR
LLVLFALSLFDPQRALFSSGCDFITAEKVVWLLAAIQVHYFCAHTFGYSPYHPTNSVYYLIVAHLAEHVLFCFSQLGQANGDHRNTGPKGALGFQHPVRLYMPKSKTSEYLQHMGKKVLANFPVQATIHFYNDDSDSEEEEEDDEMEFYNYYQNCAANGVNSSRGSGDNYSVPGGPKRNISSHTGSA